MSTVGYRIKLVRTDNRLSQREFSKRIMVTQSYLSRLERDIEKPAEKLLKLIAYEFKISLLWLENGNHGMYESDGDDREYISNFKEGSLQKITDFSEQIKSIEDKDLQVGLTAALDSIQRYLNCNGGVNIFKTQVANEVFELLLVITENLLALEENPCIDQLFVQIRRSQKDFDVTIDNIIELYNERLKE